MARPFPGVASPPPEAYLPDVAATRLLRFLTLFALLLAPLGMMRAHAAMAMPAQGHSAHAMGLAAPSECGGMDQPSKQVPASSIDCTIACSVLAGGVVEVAAHPVSAAPAPSFLATLSLRGLTPESDPPPPRFS
jgi:hypothetical protein